MRFLHAEQPRQTVTALVTGVVTLACFSLSLAQEVADLPRDSGLEVKVSVSLLFIDAEAVDRDGRPMPGLTKEDFSIQLDSRSYPIYSVDDLCGCATDTDALPGAPPLAAGDSPAMAGSLNSSFVLYFDFSHLQADGRAQSLSEAEHWVREIRQPGDRTMVVAYSNEASLRELCPFTGDAGELLDAIREAGEDPELLDDFPSRFSERLARCGNGDITCHAAAMQEYRKATQSMRVLSYFLTRLQAVAGRKILLFLHQNNTIFPARLYTGGITGHTFLDGRPSDSVPDLTPLVDDVAGTAVASGTVLFPVTAGLPSSWTRDFNDSLARFTGGEYNLGGSDLREVMERAGRGCACMYRIGVELPASLKHRVFRATIGIGKNYRLPQSYRVQFLSAAERWRRNSKAVLLDPESARDLNVTAAILPVSVTGKRWDVRVQVVLDSETFSLLPSGAELEAHWEVGALLAREGGKDPTEMLGVSRVRCNAEGGCGATIVHERLIEKLRPGAYELRAFVRDRWADVYGGAKAEIVLPAPGDGAVVGPLLVIPNGRYVSTSLPLRTRKARLSVSSESRVSTGFLPLGRPPARAGDPLALLSWICPKERGGSAPTIRRRLFLKGVPQVGLDEGQPVPIGDCWSIADGVETSRMTPGRYDYELSWGAGLDPNGPIVDSFFEIAEIVPMPTARLDGGSGLSAETVQEEIESEGRAVVDSDSAGGIATRPGTPLVRPAVPATAEQSAGAPDLRPTDVRLPELLTRLAAVVGRYRDNALGFTCDETIIVRRSKRRGRVLEFEYIYAYNDDGGLRDYRLTSRQTRRMRAGKASPEAVDLNDYDLPVFVLRAYSSIFIFGEELQDLYDYEILGEEGALGRPAIKVRFAARPPHVDDVNDWFGEAWVDAETFQLLRFEGVKAEDIETLRLFENSIEQSSVHAYRAHSYATIHVDYGVERDEMRFPSEVVIRKTMFTTPIDGSYLRSPAYREVEVRQFYDNYRIYGVETLETER